MRGGVLGIGEMDEHRWMWFEIACIEMAVTNSSGKSIKSIVESLHAFELGSIGEFVSLKSFILSSKALCVMV